MGVTFLCLYTILAGLAQKKFRRDSILFLLFGMFGVFSWLLNGTLYARPKILIPFLPLVILHCVRYLGNTGLFAPEAAAQNEAAHNMSEGRSDRCALPLFPFAVIFPVGLLWLSQEQVPWILTEAGILFLLVLCPGLTAAGSVRLKHGTALRKTPLPS